MINSPVPPAISEPTEMWFTKNRVKLENIPHLLTHRPNWVIWRAFQRDNRAGFDKIPVCPKSGRKISAHEYKNHLSFEDAYNFYSHGKSDGIGFVLTGGVFSQCNQDLFLIGVDLDHVLGDPLREDHAREICQKINSYCEISPSGTGIRIFGLSTLPLGHGQSTYGEMYYKNRFLTVTGHGKKRAIIEATDALQALEKQWWPQPPKPVSGLLNLTNLYKCYHDTPRQRAELHDILSFISADCTYEQYRDVVWGILYTNWPDAEDIARKWCETAPERIDESNFFAVMGSYNPNHSNPVTVGTLFHLAKLGGRNV